MPKCYLKNELKSSGGSFASLKCLLSEENDKRVTADRSTRFDLSAC